MLDNHQTQTVSSLLLFSTAYSDQQQQFILRIFSSLKCCALSVCLGLAKNADTVMANCTNIGVFMLMLRSCLTCYELTTILFSISYAQEWEDKRWKNGIKEMKRRRKKRKEEMRIYLLYKVYFSWLRFVMKSDDFLYEIPKPHHKSTIILHWIWIHVKSKAREINILGKEMFRWFFRFSTLFFNYSTKLMIVRI